MRLFNEQGKYGTIEGFYDERFESVVEAFLANFSTRKELGASCVVKVEGKSVVDVWGGKCPGTEVPWTKDTVCTVSDVLIQYSWYTGFEFRTRRHSRRIDPCARVQRPTRHGGRRTEGPDYQGSGPRRGPHAGALGNERIHS